MRALKIILVFSMMMGLVIISCSDRSNVIEPQNQMPSVRLDLPGVTLDSAIFSVYVLTAANQVVNVHRITSDWAEMTVTFDNFGSAFDAGIVGTFTTDAIGWHNIDVTPLVQGWIDGTYPNFGLLLEQPTSPLSSYASSDRLAASIRPELKVCFTTSSGSECVTIQRGLDGTVYDATVNQISPTSNFGASDEMYSGVINGLYKYALYHFSLPQFPQLACIGDFVWFDDNRDGIQDFGEPGVPGVTVNLLDCAGNILGTDVTDANGIYGFCELAPGDYKIQFVLPNGYVFSPQDQGTNDAIDSDSDVLTGITACTTLDAGETDLTWDAGIYLPDEHCTRTIGYWKTHDGSGPQADVVTPLLPIWLGTPNGLRSIDVTNTTISHNILSQNVYGTAKNPVTKLYAQLLGAKLNEANDADVSLIASTIQAADLFLATHNWQSSLTKSEQSMVLGWHTILDNYNNGLIGPIHCD